MQIRRATDADRSTLLSLWDEFAAEQPPPDWVTDAREDAAEDIDRSLREGAAFVAESDGDAVGLAHGWRKRTGPAYLCDLYVRPNVRGGGIGTALVRAFASAFGTPVVTLEVGVDNPRARALYARLGFREHTIGLVADVERVLERRAPSRSFGSIHVQSDDSPAVERAVRQFVPRLPGRSRGSIVTPPRNGWIAVYDDVCDRDPRQLRRLARELSERMGAVALALGVEDGAVARFILFDRGGIVDEYLSVQEYYGPLPPGDVVALAANPTVVSRLTGADPAAVRAAALHASTPEELPPAPEVLAGLARAMGVAGADHGYADAPDIPGAITIERT
jgi:ribosomal protein S18 acetylase RimI-like enzyme